MKNKINTNLLNPNSLSFSYVTDKFTCFKDTHKEKSTFK